MNERKKSLVIVRGAGDISTGTIHRLFRAGFDLLVLESERPSAIRRKVAFSEAVYDGRATVEGVWAVRIGSAEEAARCRADGYIPLIVDPEGESIALLKPAVVVDAILAKRNLGTRMDMAPLTIGLGPGFEAGRDVHYVIETMRGHDLGRIISEGSAAPNTGIPGMVGGYGLERVIRAPGAGIFRDGKDIGSFVKAGEVIGRIEVPGSGAEAVETTGAETPGSGAEAVETTGAETPGSGTEAVKTTGAETPGSMAGTVEVRTVLTGVLRGIIRDGYPVTEGFKLADVDPRKEEQKNCFTISDKARCIAGSVLELVCAYRCGIAD